MTSLGRLGLAAAAAGAAALVASRRSTPAELRGLDANGHRWQAITVNLPPDDVCPRGRLPGPLAELGNRVQVEQRPAPGGWGTEVRARLREERPAGVLGRLAGTDPHQELRRALRDAKQLLETGEVLHGPEPATTRRTLLNAPLVAATRRAKREGLL